MSANTFIQRHHLTLNVGTAQEDYDFHTQILGLKSVKKAALYDGDRPVHHFYYGNDTVRLTHPLPMYDLHPSGGKS